MSRPLFLVSSDLVHFPIDTETVKKRFPLLRRQIEEECGLEGNYEGLLKVDNVHSRYLKQLIDWAVHHKNDPDPLAFSNFTYTRKFSRTPAFWILKNLLPWERKFLQENEDIASHIVDAANYLEMFDLREFMNVLNIIYASKW